MVVTSTHAVVHPRAVVVESFNAFVADTAVSRPLGPDYFAIRTQHNRVKVFHQGLYKI